MKLILLFCTFGESLQFFTNLVRQESIDQQVIEKKYFFVFFCYELYNLYSIRISLKNF